MLGGSECIALGVFLLLVSTRGPWQVQTNDGDIISRLATVGAPGPFQAHCSFVYLSEFGIHIVGVSSALMLYTCFTVCSTTRVWCLLLAPAVRDHEVRVLLLSFMGSVGFFELLGLFCLYIIAPRHGGVTCGE